jgi:AraC-like DNA-binding protein
MAPINLQFDLVGFEDIQNDKAIVLLLTFVNRCNARIPLQKNEETPYTHKTVADAFGAVVRKLHEKFRAQIGDNINAFSPENEVKKLKNCWVRGNTKQNLCEDESDVFKNSFPIPREITVFLNQTISLRPNAEKHLSLGNWWTC